MSLERLSRAYGRFLATLAVAGCVVLFAMTALGTWMPARRAMKTDPLLAIRQ